MNLFLDVVPVIIFGNYLEVYTREPSFTSSGFLQTDLKLKVSRPLPSKYPPIEKQQMPLCP